MNLLLTYVIIAVLLFAAELIYFRIADHSLILCYVLFMKKYYHLHEAYLASLKK